MGRFLRCTEDVQRIMQKHWQQASAFPDAPWNDMLQQLTDEELIAMNQRRVEMNLENSTVKELQAWLRTGHRGTSGHANKAELIARIQASMEVSPVAPCPHSRTVSRENLVRNRVDERVYHPRLVCNIDHVSTEWFRNKPKQLWKPAWSKGKEPVCCVEEVRLVGKDDGEDHEAMHEAAVGEAGERVEEIN